MVLLHVKKGTEDVFLFETTVTESNDAVIRELVRIWNARLRVVSLVGAVGELAKHGPAKHPDHVGLDEIQEQQGAVIERGEFYFADPLGHRTGNGPGPQHAQTMERVCRDALDLIDKNNVARRVPLALAAVEEKVELIRGAVTIAYPMGLPEHDLVRQLLDDASFVGEGATAAETLDENTATLWMASKEFVRNQTVRDRTGRNEKTKAVVKLQAPGAGAPSREPAVSEEERKAMMAHYFRKQEELKKLADEDEDDYLGAEWANSNGLASALRGTGSISWRPGGR